MGGWGGCDICAYLSRESTDRSASLPAIRPAAPAGKGRRGRRSHCATAFERGFFVPPDAWTSPRGCRVSTAVRHGEVSECLECADGPALVALMVISLGVPGGEPVQGSPATQKGKAERSDDSSDRQQIGLAKIFKGVRPHQEAL
ncbi:hypothetical protein GCM10009680_18220 [Streptomyces yatensis]|uniref:Uncharacterized protein n=1 Tax=Streptomyces yatensis TaxID=155177 RepID=A0ABN2GYY8_9ACTN